MLFLRHVDTRTVIPSVVEESTNKQGWDPYDSVALRSGWRYPCNVMSTAVETSIPHCHVDRSGDISSTLCWNKEWNLPWLADEIPTGWNHFVMKSAHQRVLDFVICMVWWLSCRPKWRHLHAIKRIRFLDAVQLRWDFSTPLHFGRNDIVGRDDIVDFSNNV